MVINKKSYRNVTIKTRATDVYWLCTFDDCKLEGPGPNFQECYLERCTLAFTSKPVLTDCRIETCG